MQNGWDFLIGFERMLLLLNSRHSFCERAGVKTTRIGIEGMTCLNCVTHVQKALEAVSAVKEAKVVEGEATVEHDGASDEELLRAVRAAGDYVGKIL